MKNLIGNIIKIHLKENNQIIEGIFIETDEKNDYVQGEKSICIVPKNNTLYYETNELIHTSRVIKPPETKGIIESTTLPVEEKPISVFVDKKVVAKLMVTTDVCSEELVKFIYSDDMVQDALKEKKQKSIECFSDSVYIFTDQMIENKNNEHQVSFSMEKDATKAYLTPTEMVARLNKVVKKDG